MHINAHNRSLVRVSLLLIAALALVAGHGFILYALSSHSLLSAAAVSGLVIMVVIKHLGLLGSFYALVRRHFH